MTQVTVKDIATEFELKNSVVITELKKIGVWVPSSATPVDSDIANRIRKRLQLIAEAEQEEKDKKADKTRKAVGPKVKRSIKELGKPRKRSAAPQPVQEPKPESPLITLAKPRKGRKAAYRKVEEAEEVPAVFEVPVEELPVTEPVPVEAPIEELQPVEQTLSVGEVAELVAAAAEAPAAEEVAAEEVLPEVPVVEPVAAVPAAVGPPKPKEAPVAPVPAKPRPAKAEFIPAVVPPKRRKAATGRKKEEKAKAAKVERKVVETVGPREVTFSEKITVKTLAESLGVKSNEVIRILMGEGVMAGMNQLLERGIVERICEEFEVTPSFVSFEEAAAQKEVVPDVPEDLVVRAPVVTIMGHVDHGKTSLLDYIRKTRVAEGEAGGITQHIGAYHVDAKGQRIVFIDTPGHEAFTRMRARGAQATDIVVLVVAADDGVMPQTIEAINHAKAASVPIIVAINKIDKAGSQPQRVKQELSERGLVAEDWGGDTVVVEVSAIEGTNVDLLLEMILLVADMSELKANPKRAASGIILEAKMEKGRGAVATLLVQNGTLRVGDNFLAGSSYGKIRAMFDDRSDALSEVGPGSAVEILGAQGIPQAGDPFQVVEDLGRAREMVEFRQEKIREQELSRSAKISLDDLYAQLQAGEVKELAVVLKADTQGSVEVVEETVTKLSTGKVKINVIHRGVGAISESDVLLASASRAIVIGFNVRPETSARDVAELENVEIRLYSVIYDVSRELEQAMLGLLEPVFREKYLGRAEVRQTFRVPKVGTVAGCYIQDGTLTRNSEVRLLRDNVLIYQGRISSLKRFKDDVAEVKSGYECGIGIANYNDVKIGDVIESFVREEVAPKLS